MPMRTIVSGSCGLLFGFGLGVSGMTNPAKVLDFLDVAGRWDPTLAFVMGGAFVVMALGQMRARRTERPWLEPAYSLPTRHDVDRDLVLGAAIFGIGWGLVGLCPGPAIASIARGTREVFVFLGALLAGTLLHRLRARSAARASDPGSAR